MIRALVLLLMGMVSTLPAWGLARPGVTFKVFQFPPNMIPRIDGKTDDWAIVPDSYAIGMDQLVNTEAPGGQGVNRNPKDLDVKVKVGWVKGLNRLYFLVEAYNQKWCCERPDLHNDIFEVVADGDLSGGPLIDIYHRDVWTPEAVGALSVIDPRISRWDAYYSTQGVQAQNYHIFIPPGNNDWAMDWGCAQYNKDFPYANHAYSYSFKPGQGGKLMLEFYITLFDYAGCQGPQRAVESV
ncbi:MAG: PKD domain-containing protein, partial [Candidatus Micrarchaeaceae archaeon]